MLTNLILNKFLKIKIKKRVKQSPVSSDNWTFEVLLRRLSSKKQTIRELLSIVKTKVEININYKLGIEKLQILYCSHDLITFSYSLYPGQYV